MKKIDPRLSYILERDEHIAWEGKARPIYTITFGHVFSLLVCAIIFYLAVKYTSGLWYLKNPNFGLGSSPVSPLSYSERFLGQIAMLASLLLLPIVFRDFFAALGTHYYLTQERVIISRGMGFKKKTYVGTILPNQMPYTERGRRSGSIVFSTYNVSPLQPIQTSLGFLSIEDFEAALAFIRSIKNDDDTAEAYIEKGYHS